MTKNATAQYNLAVCNPDLASEWHPINNNELTPFDVTPSMHRRVWWLGYCGHEWQAFISDRNRGRGCKICKSKHHTSFPEQALYYYIVNLTDTYNRYKIDGIEFDLYIPKFNMAIEYDGFYHNSEKSLSRDLKKNDFCVDSEIRFIRIRDNHIVHMDDRRVTIFIHDINNFYTSLDECICKVANEIIPNSRVDVNTFRDRFSILSLMNLTRIENSLARKYPEIAKEWHPNKNGDLTPEHVSYGNDLKVHWMCEKGHEYESRVSARTLQGTNCPYCVGLFPSSDFNLEILFPKLSKQWDFDKNDFSPCDVLPNSGLYAHWICEQGHSWEAKIYSRTTGKSNCPFCAGKKACKDNCLASVHPDIASEWNYDKNGDLTPYDVTRGSKKKVWWKCRNDHEWQDTITNRTCLKRECRECRNSKAYNSA